MTKRLVPVLSPDEEAFPTQITTSGQFTLDKTLSMYADERQRRAMTIPFERTRGLVQTREFLTAMLDPKLTPRTPRWMRLKAKALLKHYPGLSEIEMAHKALPDVYGPAPPFSRLSGTRDTLNVIDATKDG